jgi:hypothetical protein
VDRAGTGLESWDGCAKGNEAHSKARTRGRGPGYDVRNFGNSVVPFCDGHKREVCGENSKAVRCSQPALSRRRGLEYIRQSRKASVCDTRNEFQKHVRLVFKIPTLSPPPRQYLHHPPPFLPTPVLFGLLCVALGLSEKLERRG